MPILQMGYIKLIDASGYIVTHKQKSALHIVMYQRIFYKNEMSILI